MALLIALLAAGCSEKPPVESTSSAPVTGQPETNTPKEPEKPAIDGSAEKYNPASKPADGEEVAVIDTTMGKIVVRFFDDAAPKHVKNFKDLASQKFYDGTKFHRVIPGFMIQGGDPNTKDGDPSTWGMGGPGSTVDAEFNPIPHRRGILSMARSGDPNSAGSQFFLMHQDYPSLDGQYTAFGAIVAGQEVVDKIVQTPVTDPQAGSVVPDKAVKVNSVRLAKWPVK